LPISNDGILGTTHPQSGPPDVVRQEREKRTTLKYATAITVFFIGGLWLVLTLKDFKRVFIRSRFDEIAVWKAMFSASLWCIIAGLWLLGRNI
jgi:hypothetical protein